MAQNALATLVLVASRLRDAGRLLLPNRYGAESGTSLAAGLFLVLLFGMMLPTGNAHGQAEAEAVPVSGETSAVIVGDRDAFLRGHFDLVMKECRGQLERADYDACLEALRGLEPGLRSQPSAEFQERASVVQLRMKLVEVHKQASSLGVERPDLYYKTLFSAYTALPEAYFPHDEVLPYWNRYLRDETARSRFNRYRKMRIIARAKDDAPLEEQFLRGLQQRLVEYGFVFLDPTTSQGTPDVLLKLNLRGEEVLSPRDPRKQHKKTYRLYLDVQSLKLVTANVSIGSRQLEPEETAETLEEAREQVVLASGNLMIDILFYHTLKSLFPPSS